MIESLKNKDEQLMKQISLFQIGMLILSVYVISALFAQTFFKLSTQVNLLLDRIDFMVCIAFIADVTYRFFKAPKKLQFMKWGWIDIISSIPMVNFLRWGRLIRVIRILRILRAFRSTKMLITFLFRNRAKGTFMTAALISVLLLIFSSIALLSFETDPNSNIKSPSDAIWWGFSTITTVGYGDKYPITVEGRIVAVILMIAGVGLFGTFTAYIASLFIEPEQKKEESEIEALRKEILCLKDKIESIDNKLG
jgi:voltage-gated potassium channel